MFNYRESAIMYEAYDEIDIVDGTLFEESTYELIKEINYKQSDIIPVFFITTFTHSLAGKIINNYAHSTYSHSSMGFNPDLETLYSFNVGGFRIESLSKYVKTNPLTDMYVGLILLRYPEYIKVRDYVNNYITNAKKSRYGYGNLLNIAINRASSKKNQFKMVCSQFVDSIFKIINMDLSGKDSSLTTPQDLRDSKNTRVFMVHEGLAKDYQPKRTMRIVTGLKNKIKQGQNRQLIGESGDDNYFLIPTSWGM